MLRGQILLCGALSLLRAKPSLVKGKSCSTCKPATFGRRGPARRVGVFWLAMLPTGEQQQQTRRHQDNCYYCCWRPWARADVAQRCSAARNTTMPCSMAAQAPADPPWAIRNYGGQGICSPTLTRSEIGYFACTWSLTLPAHRPHMSATRQHALALVRPAAATPTAQAPTIVLPSSFNTLD
ncbi:hypothetical protein COCCADRAFT_22749 [Bipolaris zeicola 26-R-13]|uniref:Secreted protein n=1 Tax=Cochliobolus carbonum (strain 26-R-13) TaxID=930089 RepID=W6YJM8_COCC2|nr:uncharacterized protein COCCADRAFT_22749 [Bipolaris zeicola 26-R-13]EUC37780.1 hypothetical protein COCCADRAFT_22749 [Bipolaris zeicola 26-R-13]